MLKQSMDEGRARRLALDVWLQASRHKRATDERLYLLHDLETIRARAETLSNLIVEEPETTLVHNILWRALNNASATASSHSLSSDLHAIENLAYALMELLDGRRY